LQAKASLEKERSEKERLKKERSEKKRLDKEHSEKGRLDKERAEQERIDKERAEAARAQLERLANISKQSIQLDYLDIQEFRDQQRIQAHAQSTNREVSKPPVEIPFTKKAIPVVAPKVFPPGNRDPVRDNAAFKAANPLSSDDSFDPLNVFPMKVRVVFRPVLE
jgi:glucan-binding YG repeat protein